MAVSKRQHQKQRSYQESKFHFINVPISSEIGYF